MYAPAHVDNCGLVHPKCQQLEDVLVRDLESVTEVTWNKNESKMLRASYVMNE